MTCSRFEPEDYSLYTINGLEAADAEELTSHLAAGCETCVKGVQGAASFWYRYAEAAAPAKAPPLDLRERLVAQARASNVRPMPAKPRKALVWGWGQAAAACGVLAMLAGSWWVGRMGVNRPANVVDRSGEVAELRSEVERLRRRLEEAGNRPNVQPTPIVIPTASPDAAVPALRQALADAQLKLETAAKSLAAEQARSQQIEQELQNQRTLYAGVVKERDNLRATATAQGGDRVKLAEAQRQAGLLMTRIETLERQNSEYRVTMARQQKELEQNLRVVSFLSSPSLRVLKMLPTDKGGSAVGQAYVEDGQKLMFTAAGMPALAPGRSYQLWLIRGRAPAIVSAGVFTTDASGRGSVEFADPSMLRDVRGLSVTEEPVGGSPRPTGHKMLIAAGKS